VHVGYHRLYIHYFGSKRRCAAIHDEQVYVIRPTREGKLALTSVEWCSARSLLCCRCHHLTNFWPGTTACL